MNGVQEAPFKRLRRFLNVPDGDMTDLHHRAIRTFSRLDKKRRIALLTLICECSEQTALILDPTFLFVDELKDLLVTDILDVSSKILIHAFGRSLGSNAVVKYILVAVSSSAIQSLSDDSPSSSLNFLIKLMTFLIQEYPENAQQLAFAEMDRICRCQPHRQRSPLPFPITVNDKSKKLFSTIFECLDSLSSGVRYPSEALVDFLAEVRGEACISHGRFYELLAFRAKQDGSIVEAIKAWTQTRLDGVERAGAFNGLVATIAVHCQDRDSLRELTGWLKEMIGALSRRSQQLMESLLEDLFPVLPVEVKLVVVSVLDALPASQWGPILSICKAILRSEDALNPVKVIGVQKQSGPEPSGIMKEFIQTGDIPRHFFKDILLNDRWFKSVFLPYLVDRTASEDVEARKVFFDILKQSGRIPKKFLNVDGLLDQRFGGGVEGLRKFLAEAVEGFKVGDEEAVRELGRIRKFLEGYSLKGLMDPKPESAILVDRAGCIRIFGTEMSKESLHVAHEVIQCLMEVSVNRAPEVWKEMAHVFGKGRSMFFIAVVARLLQLCYGAAMVGKNACLWMAKFIYLLGRLEVKVFVDEEGLEMAFAEGFFRRFMLRPGAEHLVVITRNLLGFLEDEREGAGEGLIERLRFHLFLTASGFFDPIPLKTTSIVWPESKELAFRNLIFYSLTSDPINPSAFRNNLHLFSDQLGRLLLPNLLLRELIHFLVVVKQTTGDDASLLDPLPLNRTASFTTGCLLLTELVGEMWDEVEDVVSVSQWGIECLCVCDENEVEVLAELLGFFPMSFFWCGGAGPAFIGGDASKEIFVRSAQGLERIMRRGVSGRVNGTGKVARALFEGAEEFGRRFKLVDSVVDILATHAPTISAIELSDAIVITDDELCIKKSPYDASNLRSPSLDETLTALLSNTQIHHSATILPTALIYRLIPCLHHPRQDLDRHVLDEANALKGYLGYRRAAKRIKIEEDKLREEVERRAVEALEELREVERRGIQGREVEFGVEERALMRFGGGV
ncbi:hypothetical protein HDU67_001377 [Dinochytrium kinnereticum]|nr:hypothetical protein HDU67_001377 [Dinochytrium kinnereticum]